MDTFLVNIANSPQTLTSNAGAWFGRGRRMCGRKNTVLQITWEKNIYVCVFVFVPSEG